MHENASSTSQPTTIHRKALLANALFSATTGLVGVVAPARVAGWLGAVPALEVMVVGANLLVFALAVALVARRHWRSPLPVMVISFADLAWVLGTPVLLLALPRWFSPLGVALMAAIAFAVASFALLQLWGALTQFRRTNAPYTHHLELVVDVDAPIEKMWAVVDDLGSIAEHGEGLRSSVMLAGTHAEIGAVRECVDNKGQAWTERCVHVDEGQALTLEFDTDGPGFPFPFHAMRGGWVLERMGEGTRVRVWWDLQPAPGLRGDLIVAGMAALGTRGMRRLVENMAGAARGTRGGVRATQALAQG